MTYAKIYCIICDIYNEMSSMGCTKLVKGVRICFLANVG
jgi:hypothetical protein